MTTWLTRGRKKYKKSERVEIGEESIRRCYGLLKNSAPRQLKRTATEKKFEEKSDKLKGLFDQLILISELELYPWSSAQ